LPDFSNPSALPVLQSFPFGRKNAQNSQKGFTYLYWRFLRLFAAIFFQFSGFTLLNFLRGLPALQLS
jgi:hypothetical protein